MLYLKPVKTEIVNELRHCLPEIPSSHDECLVHNEKTNIICEGQHMHHTHPNIKHLNISIKSIHFFSAHRDECLIFPHRHKSKHTSSPERSWKHSRVWQKIIMAVTLISVRSLSAAGAVWYATPSSSLNRSQLLSISISKAARADGHVIRSSPRY